jgi:hypothetical protein
MKTKFQFSNVVVVDRTEIGVIVKSWERQDNKFSHEVYVRSYNSIIEYPENKIKHFVYSKILSDDELEFY